MGVSGWEVTPGEAGRLRDPALLGPGETSGPPLPLWQALSTPRGHIQRHLLWAISGKTGLDLAFKSSENFLAHDLTTPSFEVCVHEPHCTQGGCWLDSGQARLGTQALSPGPVQSTLPLVTVYHTPSTIWHRASDLQGVLSREQLGNGVEAQHPGHPRGEEGVMKKGKEVRKGGSGAPQCQIRDCPLLAV